MAKLVIRLYLTRIFSDKPWQQTCIWSNMFHLITPHKVTYPLHRCCTSLFYSTELVYNQENIVPHLYVTCSGGVSGVIKETHLVGMWITQVYMANNPDTVLKHDYKNKSIKMDNGSVNKFKFFICVLINIKTKSINKMIPIAHLFCLRHRLHFLYNLIYSFNM